MTNKYLEKVSDKLIADRPSRVRLPQKLGRFVTVPDELLKRGRYLTASAKWLYVALRSFTNIENGLTFPSYKKIMERSGLTKNAVAKGLSELELFSWVVREKSAGRGNKYLLCYPSSKNAETGQEIGDQIHPTKEMVKAWAAEQRKMRELNVKTD